jgi:hypothetical protein
MYGVLRSPGVGPFTSHESRHYVNCGDCILAALCGVRFYIYVALVHLSILRHVFRV